MKFMCDNVIATVYLKYHHAVINLDRANESMYHALGYGTIMFLQAMMTFDKVLNFWIHAFIIL